MRPPVTLWQRSVLKNFLFFCIPSSLESGFHIDDGVNFFDDVKDWSAPFFDTHQLGVRSNFDVDVKKLQSTSRKHDDVTNVKTPLNILQKCALSSSFHL